MSKINYNDSEIMTIVAARQLSNEDVCFVGIGLPSAAANLARLTHAPDIVLIYESGTIGAKPPVLPLSIGDGELAETADFVVNVPEMFRYWLQGQRISTGFLGAAQIDKYANINTTVIGGSYQKPKVRLPGAGGAPEIASACGEVFIMLKQSQRSFVEKLDFITSVGHYQGGSSRVDIGLEGKGPTAVITDMGIMRPDPDSKELTLTHLHPGISVEQVQEKTAWQLKVAKQLNTTEAPTEAELSCLRDLNERTRQAHAAA